MKKMGFSLIAVSVYSLLCLTCLSPGMHTGATWQPLLNGHDLAGWHMQGDAEWYIEAHSVHIQLPDTGGTQYMIYDLPQTDFVLKFMFQGKFGIADVLFCDDSLITSGFAIGLFPMERIGSIFDVASAAAVVSAEVSDIERWLNPDEWNEMTIRAQGGYLIVEIDDYETARMENRQMNWKGYLGFRIRGDGSASLQIRDVALVSQDALPVSNN